MDVDHAGANVRRLYNMFFVGPEPCLTASVKKPRTERKRKARAQSEGICIAFDLFMQLPMDIFSERVYLVLRCLVAQPYVGSQICSYLRPLNLYHLSLVTPRFQEILTSDDSKHIWKEVKKGYEGIPNCPPDLTEPQYARFVFATHECHVRVEVS